MFAMVEAVSPDPAPPPAQQGPPVLLDHAGLQALLDALAGRGFDVIGPRLREGAIVYDGIARIEDLPVGWTDRQDAGRYRVERRTDAALFGYAVGPHSWKRFLHPPEERLWRARGDDDGFSFLPEPPPPAPFAFIGVRACELHAIAIQDRVFLAGPHQDPGYATRRRGAFLVALNCGTAGGTCFCASMGTGPRATAGFDIALTELIDPARHEFLAVPGSADGAALLAALPGRSAPRRGRRRMETLERLLLGHPFLAGLDPALGRLLVGCARNLRFALGAYLFHEDGPAEEFYLIREGRVALELHAPGRPAITIASLGGGEPVGASWLAPPYRWGFDARASTDTRAFGLDAACLREKCEADHHLDYEMMRRLLPVMVHRMQAARRETADVASLDLVPLAGDVPGFTPGQFNMIYAFGVGEVPVSLSGDPADPTRFVHTVRAVGVVSKAIVTAAPGSVLGLRGPFGTPWPVATAEGHDLLIVAGGLGLAPLRPAIYQVLAGSERYGRIVMLYGGRALAELLFREDLARWAARADVTVAVTVDHADASWHGHVGVVPALLDQVAFDPPNTVALLCGPEVMLRFTATALRAAGVAGERIFLSMERNMKCAIGLCGHCQFGPGFVCRDRPVLRYDRIAARLAVREI